MPLLLVMLEFWKST